MAVPSSISDATASRPRQIITVPYAVLDNPSEPAGFTTIQRTDPVSGRSEEVRAEIRKVIDPEAEPGAESYTMNVDGRLVGFTLLNHMKLEDGEYAGRPADEWPSWSPFTSGDLSDKVEVNWMASPGQLEGYRGIGTRLHQLAVERMLALKADGLQLTAGWNAHGFHYKSGYRAVDWHGLVKGEDSDAYIDQQVKKAEAAGTEPDTRALGCIDMSMPDPQIAQYKQDIAGDPILKRGVVTLTEEESGRPVTARVSKEVDPFGVEFYKLRVGDEEVAYIALNTLQETPDGHGGKHLSDVVGSYSRESPYGTYGRGDDVRHGPGWVFAEMWDDRGGYSDVDRKLCQIAVEASIEKGFEGRVAVEGDWNEHATMHELGFRAQDYDGLKRAGDINDYLAGELKAAGDEHRSPNTKALGSRVMGMTAAQALDHWGDVICRERILGSA